MTEKRATTSQEQEKHPIPLEMYQIPGHSLDDTDKTLTRYQYSREHPSYETAVRFAPEYDLLYRALYDVSVLRGAPLALQTALESESPQLQMQALRILQDAPQLYQSGLLKAAQKSRFPKVRILAANCIYSAPKDEQPDLVQLFLDDPDPQMRTVLAGRIYVTSGAKWEALRQKVSHLIEEGLNSSDPFVRSCSAQIIPYTPVTNRLSLLEKALNDPDPQVVTEAAETICLDELGEKKFQVESLLAQRIQTTLTSSSLEKKRLLVKCIRYVSENERVSLVCMALNDPDPQVRVNALGNIYAIPRSDVAFVLELALQDSALEVRQVVTQKFFGPTPDGDIMQLQQRVQEKIVNGLQGEDAQETELCASMIPCAPKESLPQLVLSALKNNNPKTQVIGIQALQNQRFTPADTALKKLVTERIEQGLKSDDSQTQELFAKTILSAPKEIRSSLLCTLSESCPRLLQKLLSTPLYNKLTHQEGVWSRASFPKDDSETTLLGKTLQHKLIMRHVPPHSFLAWQRAFEAWKFWQKKGFDYVPIEPIASYRTNTKTGIVSVASGVLDINLEDWRRNFSSLFVNQLEQQKDCILEALGDLGIYHSIPGANHDHSGNFVLRFFRNEDDSIDLSHCPRLYIIDFDQAFIQEE